MTIVVHAPLAEVQAAIETDPSLRPLTGALSMRQSTLPPPRRSLEELPSIITVVQFLGTSLATHIAYDVGKKLVLDALAKRFGKDKVEETHETPDKPSETKESDPL